MGTSSPSSYKVPKVTYVTEGIDQPSLLTTEQVAAYFSLSPAVLRMWRYRKVGPTYLKTGIGRKNSVLYREADILIFLRAATHLTDRMPKFGGGRLPGGKNKPKAK